jgi:hypothetical protein
MEEINRKREINMLSDLKRLELLYAEKVSCSSYCMGVCGNRSFERGEGCERGVGASLGSKGVVGAAASWPLCAAHAACWRQGSVWPSHGHRVSKP